MAGIKSLLELEDGQWIVISGLIVAIGLIVLSILLNQAMVSGGKASEAVLDFPKEDIREFRWEVHRWVHGSNNTTLYGSYSNITNQTSLLYGTRGISVNISIIETNATASGRLNSTNMTLFITDGTTTCNYIDEFIQCSEMM